MRVQGVLRNRGLLYFYMSTSKIFLNYTGWHDVDEDVRTIADHGGSWNAGTATGIVNRLMLNAPVYAGGTGVASYV